MDSYRLFLWHADGGIAAERIDSDTAVSLLDTFDRIGRRTVRSAVGRDDRQPRPTAKLARARHLLRIARRLLDEAGEHDAAAGATLSLTRIRPGRAS